jgi:PD-(D/E)XK endonuclease
VEHPKKKGDRSTLAIMLALTDAGYELLVPFGENTRYDLVIDDGARLARVQCKTGRLRNGAVIFGACSSYAHHPNPKMVTRSYLGQIDYFAVFCPETGSSYLIPIEDAPVRRSGSLRVEPPRNSQRVGVRFAADYEVGMRSSSRPAASAGACRSSA